MLATSKTIRFTVHEYVKMSEAGVFGGRVELLDGRIVRMNAQGHSHWWAISRLTRKFNDRFPTERFWVVTQGTLRMGNFGAPDPDLLVYAAAEGTAVEMLPKPFIVVEASDSTYRKDSGVKLRMYAAAGIEDYWIVNLVEKRIEVYRHPENPTGKRSGWRYAEVIHYASGQTLKLLAYPNISFEVGELVP